MKPKLIENWAEHLFKAWSIRLAALAAMVGAYFMMFPKEWERVLALVPEKYRELVAVIGGLVMFLTASGTKLVKQGNLAPPDRSSLDTDK